MSGRKKGTVRRCEWTRQRRGKEGRKLSRDWRNDGSWLGERDERLPVTNSVTNSVRKVTRASRGAQSRDCAVSDCDSDSE